MNGTQLKALVSYVVILHLFITVVLVKSDFLIKTSRVLNLYKPPELTEFYNKLVEHHKRMDGNIQENAAIFIGDSLTQGLAVSSVATPSINYGIGGDTTLGVITRLQYYKSIDKAKIIFLAVGVNDLLRRHDEEIIANYKIIINSLPEKPIVISAILPVAEKYVDISNEEIINLNNKLKKLVSKYKNITFIDAGNDLIDSTGNLKEDNHIGDGVHLNTNGYEIWIKALKQSVINMP